MENSTTTTKRTETKILDYEAAEAEVDEGEAIVVTLVGEEEVLGNVVKSSSWYIISYDGGEFQLENYQSYIIQPDTINSVAEYRVLIEGLSEARLEGWNEVVAFVSLPEVADQMNGNTQCPKMLTQLNKKAGWAQNTLHKCRILPNPS